MAKKGGITYRLQNADSIFNAIRSVYKEVARQEESLKQIAEFTLKRIVAETRKGNDLPNERKQPDLNFQYIRWRRSLRARDRALKRVSEGSTKEKDLLLASRITHRTPIPDPDFFSPDKSNLTLTGQLLNSIDYEISESKGTIIIQPTGRRDDGLTNEEVAESLKKRGREFLGLDARGMKRIRALIVDEIRRQALKKGL